jgi:hypothetical protein
MLAVLGGLKPVFTSWHESAALRLPAHLYAYRPSQVRAVLFVPRSS